MPLCHGTLRQCGLSPNFFNKLREHFLEDIPLREYVELPLQPHLIFYFWSVHNLSRIRYFIFKKNPKWSDLRFHADKEKSLKIAIFYRSSVEKKWNTFRTEWMYFSGQLMASVLSTSKASALKKSLLTAIIRSTRF